MTLEWSRPCNAGSRCRTKPGQVFWAQSSNTTRRRRHRNSTWANAWSSLSWARRRAKTHWNQSNRGRLGDNAKMALLLEDLSRNLTLSNYIVDVFVDVSKTKQNAKFDYTLATFYKKLHLSKYMNFTVIFQFLIFKKWWKCARQKLIQISIFWLSHFTDF